MDPVIDGFQVGEDTRSLRRGIFEGAGWEMPRVRTTRLVEIRRSRAYASPRGRNAREKERANAPDQADFPRAT